MNENESGILIFYSEIREGQVISGQERRRRQSEIRFRFEFHLSNDS